MLRFWEYPVLFQDPASVYAYHLFSVHNDIIWFLIIILILVYWCLYKIIRDFGWRVFNNQSGFILYMYNSFVKQIDIFGIFCSLTVSSFLFQLYLNCLNIREIYKLGVPVNDFIFYIINWYILKVDFFFGSQWQIIDINHGYDVEGKMLFQNEKFLFGVGLLNYGVYDIIRHWHFTQSDYEYFINDRYISAMLYHYTSTAYFFSGRINHNLYFTRQQRSLRASNIFALSDILVLLSPSLTFFQNPYRFNYNSILYDTFFESQDFKHSLKFEFIWAVFPTIIILCILVPSLYLLYSLDEDLDPKLTIKVIGHQWYWSYEFNNWMDISENATESDFKFISYKFDSNIILTDNLEFGTKRLLEVDKRLIVPINVTLRFLITAGDVLHSWAVPELGLKIDAVPGRLNQILSFISYPGIYYGQCSELCGASHGFMPIVVVGIDYKNFVEWIRLANL